MKCLAIDDEPLALNVIEDFIKKIPYLQLTDKCTSAFEAIEILQRQNIDLIFLDINMPHISGIEFLKSLDSRPMVILTTAYSEFALEGFELSVIDYLVKPISYMRFLKAVNKAYELYSMKNKLKTTHEYKPPIHNDLLLVKSEYSTLKIKIDDILFIEGLKDYIKIYRGGSPVLTKSTMKNIEEKLPSDKFIRVHKSFIVSISKIETIENQRIIIGERRIPIGDQYKESFNKAINNLRL